MEAVRPPMITSAIPCIMTPLSPSPSPMGIMDRIVVNVVIRIGRRRVLPEATSASSVDIPSSRSIFAESTNRIPLFTTIPINIRNPIRDTILMVLCVMNNSRKDPISAKGIHIMTMKENLGDSNCIAITRNTRNVATRIACNNACNSSFIIPVIILSAGVTESGNTV